MRNIRVPLRSNLFIAMINGIATLAAMLLGQRISYSLPARMANMAGGGIIAAMGLWVILQAARSGGHPRKTPPLPVNRAGTLRKLFFALDDPASSDRDGSGHIDVKEVYLLALALSLNNVSNGIASGMVGLNPALTTLAVIVLSVVLLSAGVTAGRYGQRLLGSFAGLVSGMLLVAVGGYAIVYL